MGGSSNEEGGLVTGINITPLVDVTLVLLIIFIVTAKVIVTPALPADLPRGATTQVVETSLSLVVPGESGWTLNGLPLTGAAEGQAASLVAAAQAAVRNNPEVRAVVSAGGSVPHRVVFQALDLLRQGGIEHVAFGALPP